MCQRDKEEDFVFFVTAHLLPYMPHLSPKSHVLFLNSRVHSHVIFRYCSLMLLLLHMEATEFVLLMLERNLRMSTLSLDTPSLDSPLMITRMTYRLFKNVQHMLIVIRII